MKHNYIRKLLCAALALTMVAGMLVGCGSKPAGGSGSAAGSGEEVTEYPADLLNYFVAASAGGGLDIVSRAFTTQWEEALGTTFEYIYEDTGSTYLMGMNDLSSLDEDEYGVLVGLPEAMLVCLPSRIPPTAWTTSPGSATCIPTPTA